MTIPEALEYLELATPFTKSDLKNAYREALMVWHPDRFVGNEKFQAKAEARTKQINEAFALLKEIPETDYPYQPLSEEPHPRQRKASPVAAKSNAGSWFIVFAILAALGVAAFFKFQSEAPQPEIVVANPAAEASHDTDEAKEADKTPTLPKMTAASKAPTPSTPAQPKAQPGEPSLPATIPAKVPASMPVSTAQTKPAPVTPVTLQRSETDLRLEALEQAFQIAKERDAWKGYSDSMTALDKNYLAALERTLSVATSEGKLEDAIALRAEKERLEKGESLPTDQEEGPLTATPMLKELRKTYRTTAGQYGAIRNQMLYTLYDKYGQALAFFQTELTKAAKLDDALRVKTIRDRLAETKIAVTTLSSVASTSPFEKAAATTEGKAFTNSLGMKFVPVSGTKVLFCIHETRQQDYALYSAEVPGVDGGWKNQNSDGIPVGDKDDHPVCGVNWEDAQAFCLWLSKKEGKTYRLPTDREWSYAVGIGREESSIKDATPELLNEKMPNEYPWGTTWPPSKGAGNYADTSWHQQFPTLPSLQGYSDGFPTTAPVMSFKSNKQGLYDLGGNVFEWVEDWYNKDAIDRVLRGASWHNVGPGGLLSSCRAHNKPSFRYDDRGFRVVLVVGSSEP